MKTLSGKQFSKLLEQKGWVLKRINGSHHIYTRISKKEIISLPIYKNDDLKKGLQKKLLDISDISDHEL